MGTIQLQVTHGWRKLVKSGVTPQDAGAATTLFAVTGDVLVLILGIVKTSLTTSDAITLEVGVSGNTDALMPRRADATDLDAGETWQFAGNPTATPVRWNTSLTPSDGWALYNGEDIILTPTGTFTAGSIDFYLLWKPLSVGSNVVQG